MKRKKRILIAPLDWGLGHATRCIPIITALQELGAEVIIATNGRALELLQSEFPESEFYKLPAYNIQYGKKMVTSVASQLPKLIITIGNEHKTLQKWLREKNIDAVISDNRFGLWTKKIPCVFITHQVKIIMPKSLKLLEHTVFKLNRSFIRKYSELWIPDFEGDTNLSGSLSQNISAHTTTHYIGPLSRLHSCHSSKKKYDVAVVLSGPEPHRSNLEKNIIEQLRNSTYNAIIVQGKTEEKKETTLTDKIKIVSYLTGGELNDVICSSSVIFSRSGYSTVMDIAATGAKVIFIPTPGQTEQEYLADELKKKKLVYSEPEGEFLLQRSLKESVSYTGLQLKNNDESLKGFMAKWLERI